MITFSEFYMLYYLSSQATISLLMKCSQIRRMVDLRTMTCNELFSSCLKSYDKSSSLIL